MFDKSLRATLLASIAVCGAAAGHAQEQQPAGAAGDPQACVRLSERIGQDASVEAEVRSGIEAIIASGDGARCEAIVTTWETEGSITEDSLQLVATEQATERLIVQQEVEVSADAAVYQPPAEISVTTGSAEVVWTMPRQTIMIEEQAPQITINQQQPTISVEMPQPRVTVMIPEPEIIITWPESTANVAAIEPTIEVRIPDPVVTVNMPEPIVELTIGGAVPQDLVQLEDGRFAPQGATVEDLEPRISIDQGEPTITPGQEVAAPEVTYSRSEPVVNIQRADPQVTVQVVGEPDIQLIIGEANTAAPGAIDSGEGTAAPAAD